MGDRSKWLESCRDLLMRGLQRVGNDMTEEIDKEWKRKDEEHQSLLIHVSELVLKNARLVEENSRLRHQLDRHNGPTSSALSHGTSGTRTEAGSTAKSSEQDLSKCTVPYDEYHHLADKYDELHSKYQDAKISLKQLERKNAAVMEKNREMKENVKAWQQYVDKQIKKKHMKSESNVRTPLLHPSARSDPVTPLPALPSSSRASEIRSPQPDLGRDGIHSRTLHPHVPHEHFASGGAPHRGRTADTNNLPKNLNTIEDKEQPERRHDQGFTHEDRPNHMMTEVDGRSRALPPQVPDHGGAHPAMDIVQSSQATQGEETQNRCPTRPTVLADDDDVPQFVSERCLKRKRNDAKKLEIYQDQEASKGTRSSPCRIKEEQSSSPPSKASETKPLTRTETLDLDDVGTTLISPQLRRSWKSRKTANHTVGHLRHERSRSLPINEDPVEKAGPLMPVNGEHDNALENENRAQTDPPGHRGALARDREALHPIDANMQPLTPLIKEEPSAKRRKREELEHRMKFAMLAESGEEPPPFDDSENMPPPTKLTPDVARAKFNERLRASKATGSITKTYSSKRKSVQKPTPKSEDTPAPTDKTPTRPTSRGGGASGAHRTSAPRPSSRLGDLSDPGKSSHLSRRSNVRPSSRTGPQQDSPPLRSKPLKELKISDFKPNPAYNHGYSYAFSETVRNRDARACLPGCTKPECCGSTFRALAAAAAPLPSSQEEDLLEDFLGDAYNPKRIANMTDSERSELVLQARTRQMATKHGKHKQAYERRATPPGFWRADFPTTQEQMDDREKAAQMEMNIVEERRREALRRGGKWLFRDE